MKIKNIEKTDMHECLKLVWDTFLKYDAKDYTKEGIETFRTTIQDKKFLDTLYFLGAYEDDKLIGMIATSNFNHISLFFVDSNYQKKGIGRKLFDEACKLNKQGYYTVNSSPYARQFYEHLGFKYNGSKIERDGIIVYPMQNINIKEKKKNLNNYDIVDEIKKYIILESNKYWKESFDHYDFWNEHIKYVYEEAEKLAIKYNADIEIVCLGALLHDIALIKKVGTKEDHHINGKKLALEILKKYNYPKDKLERVLGCVLNHRSSKNATNIEEVCVCDADVLAHFRNIPMIINSGVRKKVTDIKAYLLETLEKDYNDLSDETKESFKNTYESIYNGIISRSDFNEIRVL